jgi:uncharacterized protein YbjT (DUF2867 family)
MKMMKVLIFGATGMIGQGVLRECLADPDVTVVQTIGRTATGVRHPKLRELVEPDLFHLDAIRDRLDDFDACFFCLGVSSTGMSEADYHRITYDLTVVAADTVSRLNPQMTFIFVSGAGTDSSEQGRSMWARVKGKAENALLQMPFKAAYMFRPGFIEPLDGIRSRTAMYRIVYGMMRPFIPILRRAFSKQMLTTQQIGRAMINVARNGYPKKILETPDIRAAADSPPIASSR